ncbi:VOC family protein [Streptomyces albofaciens JCM 4342]|uniref:VOC family protein n=1 Tax=Streptomyces albofaciens TaxID=66866 RepID=UPI00123B1F5D|nr:VOC family protein [Streptomyces albofaciens]KAA6222605.1 VOC family protein [Streptomyces albofaciens JCM 4342]
MADAVLDHLVLATPDLESTAAEVAALTGVRPVPGGGHPGRGTRNALLGLGDGAYLEIIGPDPAQPGPEAPRWFGIDSLTGPRLAHWAVRVRGIAGHVARARALGYDPGEPVAMCRRTPDGGTLSWTLTPPRAGGLVPFLLDWGDAPHPAAGQDLPVVPLRAFSGTHPDPATIRAELAALGAALTVEAGDDPGLTAVLEGRNGPVSIGAGAGTP